jgi:hypothetical protein
MDPATLAPKRKRRVQRIQRAGMPASSASLRSTKLAHTSRRKKATNPVVTKARPKRTKTSVQPTPKRLPQKRVKAGEVRGSPGVRAMNRNPRAMVRGKRIARMESTGRPVFSEIGPRRAATARAKINAVRRGGRPSQSPRAAPAKAAWAMA